MPDTHLMIVHPKYASLIMTGQKLVEARLGEDRRAPYNRVNPGDVVYIKPTSQAVIGKAVVHRVDQYSGLTPADIDHLQRIYNDRVLGDDSFWASKQDATHATFITLNKVTMISDESSVPDALLTPSRDAWRVLHEEQTTSRKAA
jgi:predicted transcriptional regulator